LGGATGLDKSTGGTLVINSANTFSGATNINAGTLDLTGSLASVVNVNAGTLTGSGTINNDVNVFAGTVAPGTGPSTLTVTGDFNLSSGSTLSFELAGNNMTVGGGINDLVTSVVDLTLDGTLNVIELGAGSFLSAKFGDKWRIFNYSGSLTDLGLALGSMPSLAAGYSFRIDTSTFGQVNLIAVPEPSSVMALSALGVVGLLVLRRRRNRAA
jgi:autotransporter-associated beta strand protein